MIQTVIALVPLLAAVALTACGGQRPEAGPKPTPVPGPAMKPLPDSGFKVEWMGLPGVPAAVPRGTVFAATVTVKNTSDQVWLDPNNSDATRHAAGAVRLGYRWWKGSEEKKPNLDYGDTRGDLLEPLSPGRTASLTVQVTAPAQPGDYKLQLDLCQELVSWFESKGAARLVVPVKVK